MNRPRISSWFTRQHCLSLTCAGLFSLAVLAALAAVLVWTSSGLTVASVPDQPALSREPRHTFDAGTNYSMAIRSDGSLWTWGYGLEGVLGDGTCDSQSLPIRIGDETNWMEVSAGSDHSLAIKADGSLWTWGRNWAGQLGLSDSSITSRLTPTRVGTGTDWEAVSAGGPHSLALRSNGSLWAWGRNNFGQLGDGTTKDRGYYAKVGSDVDWEAVSAGGTHSLAIKSDGSLWAWGDNRFGQLGDGTTGDRYRPFRVGTTDDWVMVSAGATHSLGIRSDGSLWTWGDNSMGRLGDGATKDRHTPVRIGKGTDWVAVSAGGYHSLAVKRDGSLWSWGYNSHGQLGDGTTTDRYTPTAIDLEGIVAVAAGCYHSLALKRDGTLWACGTTALGSLDAIADPDQHEFVQVLLEQVRLPVDERFSDVPAGHRYSEAIYELAGRGAILGFADDTFRPDDLVTRQQFTKMIALSLNMAVTGAEVCPYTDVAAQMGSDPLYPSKYVAVCSAAGITQGRSATSFDPYSNVTGYQVITMVTRAADHLQPGLLTPSPTGFVPTGGWGSDPTHGVNAARAEHNGLLAGLDLTVLNPHDHMARGEVAQALYNLLSKISHPSTTSTTSTTSTIVATYTLNVAVSPEDSYGTVTRDPDLSAYPAGSTVILTAVPGWFTWFDSWLGDVTGTDNPVTVVMDSDKTIVALFGGYTSAYGLTVTVPGGHGTVTRQPDDTHYPSGTTVRLTAVADVGYKFAGWGGDAAGLSVNPLNVYMDSDKTITALFVPEITYSLTTTVAGNVGGTVSRNPNLTAYAPGSTVQVLGVPSPGYYLHHWGGDASGTANPITVTMNSNKTVTAFFAPKPTYTLTITVPTGHGTVSKSPSKTSYYSGESVTLTPVPGSGYMFDHWGGSASGTADPLTVVMNSNKTISAYFVEILY